MNQEAVDRRKAMEAEWAALGHPDAPCVGHGWPGLNCPAPEVHAQKAAERERDLAAQAQEARGVLKGLLASLESVQKQRKASSGRPGQRTTVPAIRAQGEVIGLQVAIDAIKRRLR